MAYLNRLRLARLERGLSQWHVSQETKIHQSLLSLYERELREPSEEHKEILAKLYGKEVRDLWK
jgi:transcriptional regulator with XRE-family HTH domain